MNAILRQHWRGIGCVVLVLVAANYCAAKEARPPRWPQDVLDTFFADAHTQLEGQRPNYNSAAEQASDTVATQSTAAAADQVGALPWSQLVTAEVLETEVKRLQQALTASLTTRSTFVGGGYKGAQRAVSELAIVFAVVAQFDGAVRWQDSAAGFRDLFARAASHLKVGNDTTYRESLARKQDLAELIRGGRPTLAPASKVVADWSTIAPRPALMQRLAMAHQERLIKWTADPTAFHSQRNEIIHEAQIAALLSEVIHRENFEFWDDEAFVEYARQLTSAARDLTTAAQQDNFQAARAAIDRATKSCANCHDGYRG